MKEFNLADATNSAPDKELTDNEKKIAAFGMGINLALVKLVLEGAIEPEQQMHFMIHFQDYASRLYLGEDVAVDNSIFKLNSKLGAMFYKAGEDGLLNGKKYTEELTEMSRKQASLIDSEAETVVNPDLAKTRTLN